MEDKGNPVETEKKETVEIWQSGMWMGDICILKVICGGADFNYNERRVSLRAIKQIGSSRCNLLSVICLEGWVEGATFDVVLTTEKQYKVIIGKQEHILSPIVKS